jgi:hypothetical protein
VPGPPGQPPRCLQDFAALKNHLCAGLGLGSLGLLTAGLAFIAMLRIRRAMES